MENRSLKDKFNAFEPEVDDAVIDANWNKLKPQLEERKGFWWLNGIVWAVIGGAVLLASLSVFLFLHAGRSQAGSQASGTGKQPAMQVNAADGQSPEEIRKNEALQKQYAEAPANATQSGGSNAPGETESQAFWTDTVKGQASELRPVHNGALPSVIAAQGSARAGEGDTKETNGSSGLTNKQVKAMAANVNSSGTRPVRARRSETGATEYSSSQGTTVSANDASANASAGVAKQRSSHRKTSIAPSGAGKQRSGQKSNHKNKTNGSGTDAHKAGTDPNGQTADSTMPGITGATGSSDPGTQSKNGNTSTTEFEAYTWELTPGFLKPKQEALPLFDPKQKDIITRSMAHAPADNRTSPLSEATEGRIFVDLMGGVNLSQTKLKNSDQGSTSRFDGTQPSFGLNLGFYLTEKWTLNAQLMYNTNVSGTAKSTAERIYHSGETHVDTVPGGGPYTIDSVHRYLNYSTTLNLPTKQSFSGGIGIGYELFARSRFSVEGALYVDFKYTKYTLQSKGAFDPDTIFRYSPLVTYSVGPQPSPAYFVNPDLEKYRIYNSEGKKSMLNIGLRPNLMLCYRLRNHLYLVLRASYAVGLLKKSADANGTTYKITENNFMGNIGLRIRF